MKRDTVILCSLIIAKLLLHFILINSSYELQRDEYLHLDQGNHLAWGYLSVPPFTSWTSMLILHSKFPGFWVKFFPAMWGAATIAAGWHIAKTTGGNLFAKSLVGVALLFSVILRVNILYQPNSFEILSWTLIYLFLIKFIYTLNNKWLYYLSITVAVGFLNKYNIIFPAAAILAALIILPERKFFFNRHIFFAAALCIFLILPNIIWQYQNHFPVIVHMKQLAKTQLVNVNPADFLKNQVMFFAGTLFLIAFAFTGYFLYRPFRALRFIKLSYCISILFYLYFHAKDYYAIGLYPVLIATGSVYFEHVSAGLKRRWMRIGAIASVILMFIPFCLAFPVFDPDFIAENNGKYKKLGMLKWEDGKVHAIPQDFADMLGWKELSAKTLRVSNSLNDKKHTLILCENYGQAGAINYYTHLHADSYSADYIYWFKIDYEIKNIIYIEEKDTFLNVYKGRDMFESMILADSITNVFAREVGTKIWLFQRNKQNINEIIKQHIQDGKNE